MTLYATQTPDGQVTPIDAPDPQSAAQMAGGGGQDVIRGGSPTLERLRAIANKQSGAASTATAGNAAPAGKLNPTAFDSTSDQFQMAPAVQQSATARNEQIYPHLRGAVTNYLGNAIPFGDEVMAGIGGALSWAEGKATGDPSQTFQSGYDTTMNDFRSTQKNYQEQHPIESVTTGIGGMASGLAVGGAGLKAAATGLRGIGILAPKAIPAALPAARTVMQNVGRGAAIGTGVGTLYGYGEGEGGVKNRLLSGAGGAITGGFTGAVLEPVGSALANSNLIKQAQRLIPTAAKNRAAGGALIEQAKQSGVFYKPAAFDGARDIVKAMLASEPKIAISAKSYPQMNEALRVISQMSAEGNVDISKVIAYRSTLTDLKQLAYNDNPGGDEARLMSKVVRDFDKWFKSIPDETVYPGTMTRDAMSSMLKEGRLEYFRSIKGKILADAVKEAQRLSDQNDTAFEDNLRKTFGKVVKSDDYAVFSRHEQDQIYRTMKGGNVDWIRKAMAQGAPGKGWSGIGHGGGGSATGAMIGGALGLLVGAPGEGAAIGAATVPALGYLAKRSVRKATKGAQQMSEALVNSGGNLPYVASGPYSRNLQNIGQGVAGQFRPSAENVIRQAVPQVGLPSFAPYPQRP